MGRIDRTCTDVWKSYPTFKLKILYMKLNFSITRLNSDGASSGGRIGNGAN